MTRYQTYQLTEPDENGNSNYMTIDTNTEGPPSEFFAGPFMVNVAEAKMIEDGAMIEVLENGKDVTVYHPAEIL